MKKHAAMRWLASALAVAAIVIGGANPAQRAIANSTGTAAGPRSTLRIGMWTLWRDREVTVGPDGDAQIRLCESCAVKSLGAPIAIRSDADGLLIGRSGSMQHSSHAWLTGSFTLAAHGELVTMHHPVAIAARAGVLTLVVTLPVESYVERVVASESGPADSLESMKALAVVVRSYALHERHDHADFDLCDSTHCQLLHWTEPASRSNLAAAATLATAGETLWFRGEHALGYFSKDCGGHTASPSEIWPRANSPSYLPSRADRYCISGGGNEWASDLALSDLTKALAEHGVAASGWRQLTVARRGESGRAIMLRLDSQEISAEDFRIAIGESLGWNKIPSTWFEVSRQGDRFQFHGRGWGHGVGLCQKGAAAMAAQQRNAAEILAQYFPSATAADEATGRTWKSFAGDGVVLESLDDSDAAFLPQIERARAEAAQRSGLNAPQPFTVRAFASTQAFRDATLTPGSTAAFTRGDRIAVQPLRTLAARHLLPSTMRHEFLHALIEREAGVNSPLWLREGLAESWGEDVPIAKQAANPPPTLSPDRVDSALQHATTGSESQAAHRASSWYASRLLDRYGRDQVLQWLRSGIPAGVLALRQR